MRRFADWSPNSDEYIILKQVLTELIQVFIPCESGQSKCKRFYSMYNYKKKTRTRLIKEYK